MENIVVKRIGLFTDIRLTKLKQTHQLKTIQAIQCWYQDFLNRLVRWRRISGFKKNRVIVLRKLSVPQIPSPLMDTQLNIIHLNNNVIAFIWEIFVLLISMTFVLFIVLSVFDYCKDPLRTPNLMLFYIKFGKYFERNHCFI